MTLTQFLTYVFSSAVGSAVLLKLLGMLEEWWKRRSAARQQARATEILTSVESRKLTLDEVSLVINVQKAEIQRLSAEVEDLHGKLRALAAERERLESAQEEKYESVLRAYRNLQERMRGVLRRMVALERGAVDG